MGQAYTTSGVAFIDTAGGTVLDGYGVVSGQAFPYDSRYLPDLPDYTSMDYGSVNGSAVGTIVLSRASNVLFMISSYCNTNAGVGNLRLNVGGTSQQPEIFINSTATVRTIHRVIPISAGSTVFYTEADLTAPATAMQFGGGYLTQTYLVLGK